MNRAELITATAEKAGISQKDAGAALVAMFDVIKSTVANGERVALTGFGTFEKADRKSREARNPATGATIRVAATSVPKFKAGADFKFTVANHGNKAA